ncbi:type II toxin-antitoxin system prevent-host-death family antitoxin [Aromatoleum toluclasticum]|uniref:type II toxin-antitoxin system Phd/YefM family antitoxin n=1 Tax=Aromatoleum toluclasticum TaxID=92003 RepID=UPI001D17EE63|nr:type II toxin-antitoxin system prevent-host-death family antitoxin [Aromatoleum toluclasticum]MCC4114075.1 type II toxin-antitoxin system prevent-host-death family antitoxin [Aromatoleum toluclasticum]
MRAITYTEARNNLASELDRVVNDYDVTIITRQKAEAAVLMSMREYESLMETAHLLRHPKNAMRLMKAIDDIENRRNLVKRDLIDE